MDHFVFNEVDVCELPCTTCFWGGCALAMSAVALAVAVAT